MKRVWLAMIGVSVLAFSGVAAAKPVTLHGRTADVTLEVAGYSPTLKAGSLGGDYERLVQMERAQAGKPTLIASVLVDTPPADLAPKLQQHVLSSYKKRFGANSPKVAALATPPGFWFDFEEPSVAGKTWNLYFETMVQGRWLEIHFSAVNPKPEEIPALQKSALETLRSVQFAPKPATPAK